MGLLGVDIGTSRCKATHYAANGAVLGRADREYPTNHPGVGLAELDGALVYERVCACIREAVAGSQAGSQVGSAPRAAGSPAGKKAGSRSAGAGSHPAGEAAGERTTEPTTEPVEAICFTSMGEAVIPVSADRRILGPSILGTDARGAEYVRRLTGGFAPETLYAINPNIPAPSYTMPKLCWIAEHQPELYRSADYFLSWADGVAFLLGCDPVTNFAHANRTLLFDIRREEWSRELVEAARLDAGKLGPTAAPGAVLGRISAAGAATLGLPNRPVVVAGAHDQCCNAVGAGAIEPGDAACGIGTVECITPVYDRIPDTDRMLAARLNVEHHAVPGRFVSFIYNQAGLLVNWLRSVVAPPWDKDGPTSAADRDLGSPTPGEHGKDRSGHDLWPTFDALFAEMPVGPSGLLVLPYFEPTGAPHFESNGLGAIVGLRPNTSRGRILKAIVEGETYYFVESLALLRSLSVGVDEVIATGGGSRSDAWLQVKADIIGRPVIRLQNGEAGTLGAAIVAGVATGAYGSFTQATAALVHRGDRFSPDAQRHGDYRFWYDRYRELFPALAPLMRRIHAADARGM